MRDFGVAGGGLAQHAVTVRASALVAHVQKRRVDDQLIEADLLHNELCQLRIVIAVNVSRLTTHVLAVPRTANLGIVLLAAIPAVHLDRLSELAAHRVQHVSHQFLDERLFAFGQLTAALAPEFA